jgi:hypothetical protein
MMELILQVKLLNRRILREKIRSFLACNDPRNLLGLSSRDILCVEVVHSGFFDLLRDSLVLRVVIIGPWRRCMHQLLGSHACVIVRLNRHDD